MVYTLLCPISYTQMFCQVKNLKKIHNQGKPNHYSTCSCQVKNGQYFVNRFSIHEMALSERILGRYSRKCCPILPHQKWHSSKQKYCLNFFFFLKDSSFNENWRTQGLHFCCNFNPPFPLEDGRNRKKCKFFRENFSHWAIKTWQNQDSVSSPLSKKKKNDFSSTFVYLCLHSSTFG